MQQLLVSLYFKKHDRHSYLFSVYLPTQCLFPHFTHTHTLLPSRTEENLNRRSTVPVLLSTYTTCVFSLSLFVIKITTIVFFFFFHSNRTIYHDKSVSSFSHLRARKKKKRKKITSREKKREVPLSLP